MAILSLLVNRNEPTKIQDLELDTTIRENHQYTNEITDYPIEDGSDIQDHVHKAPEMLTLEGITTDTPVRFFDGQLGNVVRPDGTNRTQIAFNTLLQYAGYEPPKQQGDVPQKTTTPQVIDIVTGYKTYTNMMIMSLTFPRNTPEQQLQYSVVLKKIRKVESERVFIPKTNDLGGKAENIDNQSAKTADTGKNTVQEVQDNSVLFNAVQGLKGLLGK